MKTHLVHSQRGVGLIEVLVTMLVLSTALMALATLQVRSLQFNQSSYLMSQMNIFAYDILDKIRTDTQPLTATSNTHLPISSFSVGANDAVPTGSTSVKNDIQNWRDNLANLPGGKGAISCDDLTDICKITITWQELDSSVAEGITKTFSYSARI